MAHLGHIGSLKFKLMSNWNYMKTNQNVFENINQTKSTSLKTFIKLNWT